MTIASDFKLFANELDGFIDRLTEPPRALRVVYEAFHSPLRALPWAVRDAEDGTLLCRSASYERACSWAHEFARRLPGSTVDAELPL